MRLYYYMLIIVLLGYNISGFVYRPYAYNMPFDIMFELCEYNEMLIDIKRIG